MASTTRDGTNPPTTSRTDPQPKQHNPPPPPPYCTNTRKGSLGLSRDSQSQARSSFVPSASQGRKLSGLLDPQARPTPSLLPSRSIPPVSSSTSNGRARLGSNMAGPRHGLAGSPSASYVSTPRDACQCQCQNARATAKDQSTQLQKMQAEMLSLKTLLHEYGERITHLESIPANITKPTHTGIADSSPSPSILQTIAGPSSSALDWEQKYISKHIRTADSLVDVQWDFTQPFSSPSNFARTAVLIELIQTNIAALPKDMDRWLGALSSETGTIGSESLSTRLPSYTSYQHVYDRNIATYFRQLVRSFKDKAIRDWGKGERHALTSEISRLEDVLQNNGHSHDVFQNLITLRDRLDSQDRRLEKSGTSDSSRMRSKLNAMVVWARARRLLSEWAGHEYANFDSVYWIPPLTLITGDNGGSESTLSWYWSDPIGVYSPEYLSIFHAIWNLKHHTLASTKRGPVIDKPPPNYQPIKSIPYFVSNLSKLQDAPQSWMFDPEWLEGHPEHSLRIVPSEVWITSEQVEKTDWFCRHPWRSRDGLKRKRSNEHL